MKKYFILFVLVFILFFIGGCSDINNSGFKGHSEVLYKNGLLELKKSYYRIADKDCKD